MYPKLVGIAGPLMGESYALAEEGLSIGRESANRLSVRDTSVSRRHCVIKKVDDLDKVIDLDSHNGTFVNGLPVKERVLEHGDQIKIGNSVFLFIARKDEAVATPHEVRVDDQALTLHSAVQLRREDALYLQPEQSLVGQLSTTRLVRDLNALLRVSLLINSSGGFEALQKNLLESIFEITPAERGVIALTKGTSDDFVSAFGLHKSAGRLERQVRVSRTVINHVLREGVAILSNDVRGSDAYSDAESLITFQTTSLLVVPLFFFGKITGFIYLEISDPQDKFDEDHLQLLMAIAGIAAGLLENARCMEWLEGEKERLRNEINIEHSMVGESAAMRLVYQFIAKVAPANSNVLIRGESGTGKELVARAIHQNSPRVGKPFVAINCAGLSETLLESELFGHEKGAFTGAIARKKGLLEVADGGTFFLDEIAELAPQLQAKLLRVLQEREFQRVGGTHLAKVNIRLLAATNQDLDRAIKDNRFRQDLYFRLNVVSLIMPPLRERREDIPLLSSYFAAKYSKECNRQLSGISREARACLGNYDWPGNVRELENAIERAVVLGTDEYIMPEDLPESLLERESSLATIPNKKYFEAVKEAKKQLILRALEEAQGNYTEAAKLLGVYPTYLHRLMRNLSLKSAPQK